MYYSLYDRRNTDAPHPSSRYFCKLKGILQLVERRPTPALLPILRSAQQAELLTRILDRPDQEESLTDLTRVLNIPAASVHREVGRAESVGVVKSRRIGATRLVSANTDSAYFEPLRQLLVMAFGPPEKIREALTEVPGVTAIYLYGSWAARHAGEVGTRPVGDLDLLVLGAPDITAVYKALGPVEAVLGRTIQVTVRPADWLERGEGSFHDTVVSRPLVCVLEPADPQERKASAARTAFSATS